MSSVITSPAIQFPEAPPAANHGSYSFTRVLPQGQAKATLNATSQQEVLIDLPNIVMNLSKSTLDYDADIPAGTGVNRILTLGQSAIERVSLYTRTGTYLVDIPNCQMYTRAVTPYVTSVQDCATYDKTQSSATEAAAEDTGKGFNNCMSRVLAVTAPAANGRCADRITEAGGLEDADLDLTEHQYLTVSASATASYLKFSIPLSEFHHTLFSVDKDLYFNQALVLRVSFGGTNKMGEDAGGSDDLGAVVIQNIRLNLAKEQNSAIANGIRQKVMSTGINQLVPYVYGYLYSSVSGSSSSQQVRLNSGHGHSLLNAYVVTANTKTDGIESADISNKVSSGAALKVASFQMSVDNNLLTEYRPDCAKNEDYVIQRHLMEDSMAGQNSNVFRQNCVHLASWRAGRCVDWKHLDTVLDGLDLSAERVFNVEKTTTTKAFRNYVFAIVQRRMSIQPNGDVIMM